MKYHINKLNRDVELDDELVNLFKQIDELNDSMFLIQIYGTSSDASTLSDEELSNICNMAIIKELQMYSLLPNIVRDLPHLKEKLLISQPVSVNRDNKRMEDLYLIMDETDAPYDENEVSYSHEDDVDLVRFAVNHGLDFKDNSPFCKLKTEQE